MIPDPFSCTPDVLLREGIGSQRVHGLARAIQLRAPLGRIDLAREIVCSATGIDDALMDTFAKRDPHPHVTEAEKKLAARFESAVHGVDQLLTNLPEVLWEEVLDLITNGYSARAYKLVMDLHGHISATLDRYGRFASELSATAAD